MEIANLIVKLDDLKTRQSQLNSCWGKTGNRDFLEFMTELLPMALHAERCSIFISNPEDNSAWIQCGTGISEKQIKVPRENSVVGEVIATGMKVIDYDLDRRIGAHDLIALKTGFTAYNTLCVPIFGRSTHAVAGAIQLLNKTPEGAHFTDGDIALAGRLARHMHINIENIFLGQQMADTITEMGSKIESIEDYLLDHGVPL